MELCTGGVCTVYYKTYFCRVWSSFWPVWVGGDEDFIKQGQDFYRLEELKKATMLEF